MPAKPVTAKQFRQMMIDRRRPLVTVREYAEKHRVTADQVRQWILKGSVSAYVVIGQRSPWIHDTSEQFQSADLGY